MNNLIHLGFYKTSLIVGSVCSILHGPMILHGLNYPDHRFLGIFMMVILCILLIPVVIYLTLKSRSVIIPSIFHVVINTLGGISLVMLIGGSDISKGFPGLLGYIVLIFF